MSKIKFNLIDKLKKNKMKENEEVVPQTQWNLMWKQFKKHRLAIISLWVLIVLYLVGVIFTGFFAPYSPSERSDQTHLSPQKINFIDQNGDFHFRPFVYTYERVREENSWSFKYVPNKEKRYPIQFFVRGAEYKLLGLFKTNLHFFGIEGDNNFYLLGTDHLGRDLLSRIIYGSRVSLTIGFIGVIISSVLGLFFGGISGLMGGAVDEIIQRLIETLMAIPKIPLWMALAAAVPKKWSSLQVFFAITVILSLMSWTGLARVVRSKFISLRSEDFVIAAEGFNVSKLTIIFRHLIPNFISYVIVNLTLAIPGMIIGETSLSFLGIGLRPPTVSLGVLLEQAQSFQTVAMHPWLLYPGYLVIVVVLAYNFVGDGLRDAADPYD